MNAHRVGWKYALLILTLVLLVALVVDFNNRMAKLRELSAELEVVSAKATNQVETRVALQADLAYATSEKAVEDWAYEDGHMVRPGDNPVVPISPGSQPPTPTPRPTVVPTQMSNLERWILLFLGDN